jgi:hypothetical protein
LPSVRLVGICILARNVLGAPLVPEDSTKENFIVFDFHGAGMLETQRAFDISSSEAALRPTNKMCERPT